MPQNLCFDGKRRPFQNRGVMAMRFYSYTCGFFLGGCEKLVRGVGGFLGNLLRVIIMFKQDHVNNE